MEPQKEEKSSEAPQRGLSVGPPGQDAEPVCHEKQGTHASDVEESPYSVYSKKEKWVIVSIASVAGLFSPFTANIYFPIIPSMVNAFHTSTERINLTVTLYMVFQGVSPLLFGALSDTVGRRIISIVCLLVLCLSCVGLALVPTSAYWLLLVLRCVQAAGCASTVAIGSGMVGDITSPSERASFFGVFASVPLIGPAIGPVLGGALGDHLGWRAVFWFLCIASGLTALVMFLILPETLRTIVGNGSIPPPKFHRPIFPVISSNILRSTDSPSSSKQRFKFKNPLPLLLNLDILLLLSFNGLQYAVCYAVTASISVLFLDAYPYLNETTAGLLFLSVGGGMAIGSVVSGRILDWDFQRMKRSFPTTEPDEEQQAGRLGTFPIEIARLRLVPIFVIIYVAVTIGYGWCLQAKVHISAPLILLFVLGLVMTSTMTAAQTLIIDYVPKQSSSVTACNNLVRCSLGAAAVAVVDPILQRLGVGWTYVLLAGICIALCPFVIIVMKIGPQWRKKRATNQSL